MVFLKVVLVGLASPRGLTVQYFPQDNLSPTPVPLYSMSTSCIVVMVLIRPVNVNRVVPALWVVAARKGGLPDV